MRKTLDGSVSIFLVYVLVFILAAVFALLEVSRVWGLEQRAEIDVVMTGNSLMAEYNKCLWEDYHLLFLDGSYGTEVLNLASVESRGMDFATENMDVHADTTGIVENQTWNLYGLKPVSICITGYGLATDQGGRAFYLEAVKAMESSFSEEALEEIYQLVSKKKDFEQPEIEVQETKKEIVLRENPVEVAERMKAKGILNIVTDGKGVSVKQADLSTVVSRRELEKGTISFSQTSAGWKDKLLFRLYLEEFFNCYAENGKDKGLDYEMEYLIAGKSTDKQNLQNVVNRLLVMRELSNLQFLRTSPEKQELIIAAATAIAAVTLTPELIPTYKTGIMAAWAYVESVSDVKLLLAGQKVSFVKTESQWHTDLTRLSDGSKNSDIKQTKGLAYQQYLQMILWTMKDSVLAYRAMDLIELNTGCNMNCQIYRLDGEITYRGEPLFSSLIAIGRGQPKQYIFSERISVTYVQE